MEKNMEINFEYLKLRVKDALSQTDLKFVRHELQKIKDASIVSGVGGSSVVSEFCSKVLSQKNGIISISCEPRDFIYQNISNFKNVICCSYSGNNYGVDLSFDNNLKKYLLSNNKASSPGTVSLQYQTTIEKEKSFISLGATLIPISILMDYYLEGDDNKVLEFIVEKSFSFEPSEVYEIFSGYDTKTASKYLESTMVESGIGIPIVHDKYSYCHGRSTLSTEKKNNAIYFNRETDFDKMMLEELKKYYQEVIVIKSNSKDQVVDDYQMLIQSMYLTKYLAEEQQKDLSKIKYSKVVKKLYKYSGKI